jgi:hypothetical protein
VHPEEFEEIAGKEVGGDIQNWAGASSLAHAS